MQTTSELSDFGFQLLGRAVSDRRVVPSCLVSAVLRERAQRHCSVWGSCSQPGGFYLHAGCVEFENKEPTKITGSLNPGDASRCSCSPCQGAPWVLSLAREAGQAVLHIRCKCDSCEQGPGERQGKPCQSVSSWSDSFSFTKPEPGQSPPWHCASFLVYV